MRLGASRRDVDMRYVTRYSAQMIRSIRHKGLNRLRKNSFFQKSRKKNRVRMP